MTENISIVRSSKVNYSDKALWRKNRKPYIKWIKRFIFLS